MAVNNTLAFMEMYQMFQERVSQALLAGWLVLAPALAAHSRLLSPSCSTFTYSVLTCVLSVGYS